ncbi:MAG: RNA polymerase sigma-70 factor [Bacteroidetes bacterium]|nr:RNA polymerase sigma-70 factor [Bacteroidota bacterium]
MQRINGIDEEVLIERLKDGDETAFELLFRFYYAGLVVFASQFTFDLEESEDIVQNFYIRLWEKRSNLKTADSLKSYFFQSVKNSCLNFLKHQKVKEQSIHDLLSLSEKSLLYDPNLYIASELQEKVKRCIDTLPDRNREVFKMSRFDGLKNEEIAEKLNISKRTVETHISNSIKILKTELKDYVGLLFLLGLF